jgi:hypothetical protein
MATAVSSAGILEWLASSPPEGAPTEEGLLFLWSSAHDPGSRGLAAGRAGRLPGGLGPTRLAALRRRCRRGAWVPGQDDGPRDATTSRGGMAGAYRWMAHSRMMTWTTTCGERRRWASLATGGPGGPTTCTSAARPWWSAPPAPTTPTAWSGAWWSSGARGRTGQCGVSAPPARGGRHAASPRDQRPTLSLAGHRHRPHHRHRAGRRRRTAGGAGHRPGQRPPRRGAAAG